jgi:tRNA G10  N-methylase Trm11
MMYAFVLGRVYTLSLAELLVVFSKLSPDDPIKIIAVSLEVIVIETSKPLDVEKLQNQLGGVIKILKVVDVVKKRELDSVNFALQHYFKPSKLKKDYLKNYSGKIQFGVSVYLLDMQIKAFGEPKRLGMFIKRSMQDDGRSIRLVIPEFNSLALASVVVTKNLLLSKGAEISVLADKDKVYVAKTLSVQDFEDYGRRDYQRPVRSELQGMIPPKVAQSMINLAGCKPNDTILDPFCGIGTIPQEGILLGYKMLGTDINKVAIAGSEKNLEWFRNRYKISKGRYHVDVSDAREVSKLIEKLVAVKAFGKISAIVTEGYLGPLYGKFPKPDEIEANFKQLQELYTDSFKEFLKILSNKSKVVISFPAYKRGQNDYVKFPSLDFITSLGYNLVDLIPSNLVSSMPFLRLTDRKTTIYDRKDQIVAREIVVFEKAT